MGNAMISSVNMPGKLYWLLGGKFFSSKADMNYMNSLDTFIVGELEIYGIPDF